MWHMKGHFASGLKVNSEQGDQSVVSLLVVMWPKYLTDTINGRKIYFGSHILRVQCIITWPQELE